MDTRAEELASEGASGPGARGEEEEQAARVHRARAPQVRRRSRLPKEHRARAPQVKRRRSLPRVHRARAPQVRRREGTLRNFIIGFQKSEDGTHVVMQNGWSQLRSWMWLIEHRDRILRTHSIPNHGVIMGHAIT